MTRAEAEARAAEVAGCVPPHLRRVRGRVRARAVSVLLRPCRPAAGIPDEALWPEEPQP